MGNTDEQVSSSNISPQCIIITSYNFESINSQFFSPLKCFSGLLFLRFSLFLPFFVFGLFRYEWLVQTCPNTFKLNSMRRGYVCGVSGSMCGWAKVCAGVHVCECLCMVVWVCVGVLWYRRVCFGIMGLGGTVRWASIHQWIQPPHMMLYIKMSQILCTIWIHWKIFDSFEAININFQNFFLALSCPVSNVYVHWLGRPLILVNKHQKCFCSCLAIRGAANIEPAQPRSQQAWYRIQALLLWVIPKISWKLPNSWYIYKFLDFFLVNLVA